METIQKQQVKNDGSLSVYSPLEMVRLAMLGMILMHIFIV